ncbi:hypothetical protein [Microvirga subterranea]|uniref:Uncharacterized protein n=1 Tax=Microvirga subterranea TaxID=186651 RepID=A0A370HJY5_9HYPH|nr:hypothetical protein [Microvirga subterranea]RDI58913.1 hypothetical protein DES45_105439 [Microvirga subterranea]
MSPGIRKLGAGAIILAIPSGPSIRREHFIWEEKPVKRREGRIE